MSKPINKAKFTTSNLKDYITLYEGERWKPLTDWEDRYLVSSKGRVFSIRHKKIMRPFVSNTGNGKYPKNRHQTICLCRNYHTVYKKLHSIIASEFLIKPEADEEKGRLELHHVNCDPTDNSVENLIWLYRQQHMQIHKLLRRFNRDLTLFEDSTTTTEDKSA